MKLITKVGRSILAVLLAFTVVFVFPGAITADADDATSTIAPLAEPVWLNTILVPTNEATVQDAIDAAGTIATEIILESDQVTAVGILITADRTIKITSRASGPWVIDGEGGNFSVLSNYGELWLEDIVITGGNFAGNGGGVFNYGELYLNAGATISGNSAGHNGGGVCNNGTFTLCGGTITENTAADNGAGVFNAGTFIMSSGTIGGIAALNGNTAGVNGGGVYNYGNTADPSITVTFTMTGGTIINNAADKGGGVYNDGSDDDAIFNLEGGTISNNTATASGGSQGGGVCNNSDSSYTATFNMSAGTISDNEAYDQGGGVWNNGAFALTSGTISGNYAGADGGGVYSSLGLTMSGGEISGNSTSGDGGGVCAVEGFTMSGGEISGNGVDATSTVVTQNGGGVYVRGAFDMSGGTISDNSAEIEGGGVRAAAGPRFVISDQAEISGNEAGVGGGGVCVTRYDSVEIEGGQIIDNTAGTDGGGGLLSLNEVVMSGGLISGNTTTGDGGGIKAPHLELSAGLIINNTASGNGGGVYISSIVSLIMTGGSISGNTATDGGGVYGAPAGVPMSITGGTISANTATSNGGGIWINDLANLTVGSGVVFLGNTAQFAVKDLSNLYMPAGVTWTTPFTYGNNNFDINYAAGSLAFLAFVNYSFATPSGANGYLPGEVVTINAGTRAGYTFAGWTVMAGTVSLASPSSATTTFTMPGENVTVQANWTPSTVYRVTISGSYASPDGSGTYQLGDTVTINAGTRTGYTFTGWTVSSNNVTLADPSAATTTFAMPAEDVILLANWKAIDPDDPDNPVHPPAANIPAAGDSIALGLLFALCFLALGTSFLILWRRQHVLLRLNGRGRRGSTPR